MLFGCHKDSPLKLVNTSGALASIPLASTHSHRVWEVSTANYALVFPPSAIYYPDYPYSYTSIIRLGSGVGAATVDDYNLQKQLTSGYTASLIRNSEMVDSSGYCFGEATINVIATKSIVIGELGFFYKDFLLDRTVLDTPVSLKNGQTATIKYRITNASTLNA